ncbi:MAG TPA: hypothetical protein VGI45_19900 [Terracidiphilus sp.]|jgi:hypothetical protein
MKRITSIMAESLVAVLIAGGGFTNKLTAQNEPGAIFSVPFSFTADGYVVAAGTYEVNLVSSQYLMSIRNVDTGEKQIFTVRPEQQPAVAARGLLVFHRCGQRKDLTEFHLPGSKLYSAAISPRHGRNSEVESCSSAESMTVAAR